jgi:hypothetical protein
MTKSAEACFATTEPPYLGLKIEDIGMAGPDLLADKLPAHGDPEPEQVRAAAVPLASKPPGQAGARLRWNTFVGARECYDTMPVFPGGSSTVTGKLLVTDTIPPVSAKCVDGPRARRNLTTMSYAPRHEIFLASLQ